MAKSIDADEAPHRCKPSTMTISMTDLAPTVNPPLSQARTWDMLCHLSALAGYIIPFGNIIGPLLVWQLKKNEYPSVDAHGKEAVNFQISVLIYFFISVLLSVVLIGIPLLIAVGLGSLVLIVIASIKANNGEAYRYPLTIRFIK
jgi:uncharacterized Tic20 family protein